MDGNERAFWAGAVAWLRGQGLGDEALVWFTSTVGVGVEDTTFVVGVPDAFTGEWLKGHYVDEVLAAVRSVWPSCSGVRYVVDERAAVAAAESRGAAEAEGSKPKPAGKPVVVSCRLDKRYTFERFVVGEGNRFAYAAMKAAASGGAVRYNPIYLYGATGVGKTHLMQAYAAALREVKATCNVIYVSSEEFATDLITSIVKKLTDRFRTKYRKADVLLVDDVQFLGGKDATQEEFFHLFNFLIEGRKRVLLSAERRPEEISRLSDRLVSRFGGGLVVEVEGPDLETRRGIVELRAMEEKVEVGSDVVEWIAEHARANVRELEGALVSLVAYAKLDKKAITLDLAKRVLRDLVRSEGVSGVTIEAVQRAVAEAYGVRVVDLVGSCRQRRYAMPRHVAMALAMRLVAGASLGEVGKAFGGRDHSTVVYARERVDREVDSSPEVRGMVSRIGRALGG
jgi:chromosomal replication initiator protein